MSKKERKFIKKLTKSDFNNPKTYLVLIPDEELPPAEDNLKKGAKIDWRLEDVK